MIKQSLFLLLSLLSIACSSSESVEISSQNLVHEDDHLGEYMQALNSREIITVSRSNHGLAIVNMDSHELRSLDASATEARELIYRAPTLVYRVDDKAYFISDVMNNSKPEALSITPKRLLTFEWMGDWGRLSFETPTGDCRWVRFNKDLTILAEGALPGIARASILRRNKSEWILINNKKGLFLGRWQKDEPLFNLIEPSHTGDFANLFEWKKSLYLTYLDRNTGVLKLARDAQKAPNFRIEQVDGTPFETYRGMDLTFFDDGKEPGFLYLDAWKLHLRMARYRDGVWHSKRIPLSGATGFYSLVLDQTDSELEFVTHSFRTDHPNGESSFENLVHAKIKLKP